jgi:hypothetical protein
MNFKKVADREQLAIEPKSMKTSWVKFELFGVEMVEKPDDSRLWNQALHFSKDGMKWSN